MPKSNTLTATVDPEMDIDHAKVALPDTFWIVSSISARVNGFEITSSTAALFLENTVSFPAPVMMTTRVAGELFLMLQAKATPSIPGIS